MDGDGLLGKTGWPAIDLAVISYVYYHYMSNEHCADWLARLLHAGAVKAVLIISRFEDLSQNLDAVARRGVHVVPLMRKPRHSRRPTDHRQLLYVSPTAGELPTPLPQQEWLPSPTPTVPAPIPYPHGTRTHPLPPRYPNLEHGGSGARHVAPVDGEQQPPSCHQLHPTVRPLRAHTPDAENRGGGVSSPCSGPQSRGGSRPRVRMSRGRPAPDRAEMPSLPLVVNQQVRMIT